VAAVKALMTLLGNWRRPLGDLRHAGLVPSSAVHGFDGFRAVDSWKQAVALARVAPDLAQDQLRALFAHQGPDGMVPGSVSMHAAKHNRLHTGPPLAAWAAWEVYRQAGDRSVLHELLPLLRRYHDWWAERRDRDRDGLCEYGAAAERVEAAKAESGMDDAARFQKAGLRRVDDAAWTLDVESVDLNAYLFAEKRHLAQITKALLREDPELEAGAARLQAAVRAWMFDRESAYFYDVLAGGDGGVRIQGAEGWIPLWAGLATEAQALAVRRALVDPAKFATALPFPTLGADQPGFDARARWRGAVWLDQAYFAVHGLRRYGFTEDAHRLARQLLDRADGLTAPGTPIRENYDPLTGQGLSIPDFSPSAAAVLLLLWGQ
jgi:putative isomerase